MNNSLNAFFFRLIILTISLVAAVVSRGADIPWKPDFYTTQQKDIQWGAETNCLKAGVLLQYNTNQEHTLVGFFPALNNSCTSNCWPGESALWVWLPPFDGRYQMTLTDSNGVAVAKTAKGLALGAPITAHFRYQFGVNVRAYHGQFLDLNTPDVISFDPMVLEDYFKIVSAGKYHLQFEMVVLLPRDHNLTNFIHLPPVDAGIEIKNP